MASDGFFFEPARTKSNLLVCSQVPGEHWHSWKLKPIKHSRIPAAPQTLIVSSDFGGGTTRLSHYVSLCWRWAKSWINILCATMVPLKRYYMHVQMTSLMRWHHKYHKLTFLLSTNHPIQKLDPFTSSGWTAKTCPMTWHMFHSHDGSILSLTMKGKEPWGHVARRHKTQNFHGHSDIQPAMSPVNAGNLTSLRWGLHSGHRALRGFRREWQPASLASETWLHRPDCQGGTSKQPSRW